MYSEEMETDPMSPWYIQTEKLIQVNKKWKESYKSLNLELKWKIIQEATIEIKNSQVENINQINESIISKLEEIYENQDYFWKEFKNELNSNDKTGGSSQTNQNKFSTEEKDEEEEEYEEMEEEICIMSRNESEILGKSVSKNIKEDRIEK